MNPYEIIGVEKTASIEDIKRAYRRLSLKHHPDRNGNSEESKKMFQNINQSYEILSKNIGVSQNIIKRSSANNQPYDDSCESQTLKPETIVIKLLITLEQAYSGCMIPVEIERTVIERNIKQIELEKMYIQIPKGIDNNEIIMYKDKGNISNNGMLGDLKIIININKHTVYERNGLDLIYIRTITLKDALCGVSFQMPHISGKKYTLSNIGENLIITPNFKRIVAGLGLVRDDHKGDLIIKFIIQFPKHISKDNIKKLADIL